MDTRNFELIPERFPFIIFRHEWFGGFLFNRFLSYTEINPLQARVLELSEGYFSIKEIKNIISREFNLSELEINRHIDNAFDLFDRYYAINWRRERKRGEIPPYNPPNMRREPSFLSAPLYVLWDITYACNLSCKHCLVDAGNQKSNPMSLRGVFNIVDQLVNMKVLYINFLGGEPFLRQDMLEILNYVSRYPIGMSVTTNGILVNDNLIKQLENINLFDVQVSLDGLEKTHDKFRNMEGAFQKATNSIKLFSNAGFRTTINTVMTRMNSNELESMVELAISLGAYTFKAVSFLPVGRGKLNRENLLLTPELLMENVTMLQGLQKKHKGVINILTEKNYPLLIGDKYESAPATSFPSMGCAAGTSQLVIDPNGRIYACPFLHDFLAGDLQHQSLGEIWKNSAVLNMFRNIDKEKLKGKCHNCHYLLNQCHGGCRASAYALTGDLWSEDPLCWHLKH
ncbi:MAG: radical SAM protein [Promethearchaeota archaeon]